MHFVRFVCSWQVQVLVCGYDSVWTKNSVAPEFLRGRSLSLRFRFWFAFDFETLIVDYRMG